MKKVYGQTQADPVLQQLKNVILKGWPNEKHNLPDDVKPFFCVRDEMAVYDGLIFKGERCPIMTMSQSPCGRQ